MIAPPSESGAGRAVALILGGAVLWGTTGTAQALGPASASPFAVGTTRLVLGGALLVGLAALRRRRRTSRPLRRPASGPVGGGVLPAGLAGAVGVVAYQLSFFAAVDRAGVAVGTTVAIGSSPLFTGAIDGLLTRRPPGRIWWLSTLLGIAGLVALAGAGGTDPASLLLALAAGGSYAAYAIASKRLLDAGLSSTESMAVVFGGGALLILPGLAVSDLSFLGQPDGVVMLLWLGAATVLLAYVLFAAGLAHLSAPTVATLSLAEPLTAAVLGLLVLGEAMSPRQAVGAGLMAVALAVLARGARTVARAPVPPAQPTPPIAPDDPVAPDAPVALDAAARPGAAPPGQPSDDRGA